MAVIFGAAASFGYETGFSWPVVATPVTGVDGGFYNTATSIAYPSSQESGWNWWIDVSFTPSAGGGGTGGGTGGSTVPSLWYDNTVIAQMNAVAALLNRGTIQVYTGAQPALNGTLTGTLLATLTFGASAFASAVAADGIVTAVSNLITPGTATATGTAGYFALVTSGGATVLTGTVGIEGSDADMIISQVSITAGTAVGCSEFSLAQSETGT